MKAKHTIARIKSTSVWQKIFCALIAVSLLLLMVPNGLRANAITANDEKNSTPAEEVNKAQENGKLENNLASAPVNKAYAASDLPTLGSSVTFDAKSFNMDETSGYFKVQTAKVTVEQLIYYLTDSSITEAFNSMTLDKNGNISEQDMAAYITAIAAAGPSLPFDQLDYYEKDYQGSYTAHTETALVIPDYLIDFAEELAVGQMGVSAAYIITALEVLRNGLNSLIPSNTELIMEFGNQSNASIPAWPFTNDGSIFLFNMYLGQGNSLMDVLKTANLTITRVIPMNQGELADPMFSNNSNDLLTSNKAQEKTEANLQPFFMNWDIDLFGTGYSLPVQAWQSFYGPLDYTIEILGTVFTFKFLNYKPLKIPSLTNVRSTATFYDVEGLVPVHLNFSDAYVHDAMRAALRHYGWTCTDFTSASVWTKYYWKESSTWFVYQDIMQNFGPWIFGGEKNWWKEAWGEPSEWSYVYKDEMIRNQYWNLHFGDDVYFENWTEDVPFPGPYMFESDNENWFGTLDKETTFTFSCYPVSPRGHVVHEGHGDYSETPWEIIFDVADPVNKASVMFYNEWDMPLFKYSDQQWDSKFFADEDNWKESGYFYASDFVKGSEKECIPQYCFDVSIDHAIVYAWDEDPEKYSHDIYIPLRVNWDQFDSKFATLFDYGMCDFVVERLMFADVATYMPNAGVESYEVTYFEDGQPLFETQTISDPWQMAMLTIPMVTHGTITTGDDRLVTGWNAYMSFNRPFGEVDAFNAFQDSDNYSASDGVHWFQCQIKANMKPGFVFTNWFLDNNPISADTYKGEPEIIVKEPGILLNHWITAGYAPLPIPVGETDGQAIYGDAASAAIYGNATAPVNATPDGNAAVVSDGTAQTSDSAGLACAILALVALAAGITATRKIMVK